MRNIGYSICGLLAFATISACAVTESDGAMDSDAANSRRGTHLEERAAHISSEQSESTEQWVTVGTAPAGSTIENVRGTKDEAGRCQFKILMALAPGEQGMTGDQVRIDPENCVTEVAVTRGKSATPSTSPAESSISANRGERPQGIGVELGDTNILAFIQSRGYLRTFWEDPIFIDLNGVKNEVDWFWDNASCLVPNLGGFAYDWFTPSGWNLLASNWQNVFNCSLQTSSSFAHFRNGIFCLGADSDTVYDRNTVHGSWDGTLYAEWFTVFSGPCTVLASFHYDFQRTLN